jgi:hypothetical protein
MMNPGFSTELGVQIYKINLELMKIPNPHWLLQIDWSGVPLGTLKQEALKAPQVRLGMVTQACNPRYLGGGDWENCKFETSLG